MLSTHENEDVDADTRQSLCPRILALVLTVERPVNLTEAALLIEWPADFPNNDLARQEAIGYCRSLVTLGVDDEVIHMVHQSAKDFLLKHAGKTLFPAGAASQHLHLAHESLAVMSKTLHEGMKPLVQRSGQMTGVSAPVDAATHCCLYWVDHLQLGLLDLPKETQQVYLRDGGPIHVFLQTHLLHWFEFIALHGVASTGITALSKLIKLATDTLPVDAVLSQSSNPHSSWGRLKSSIFKVVTSSDSIKSPEGPQLLPLARDALRCLRVYGAVIEDCPMQVYASMLLFSPSTSLVRQQYLGTHSGGNLGWVRLAKPIARGWTACIHTLHAPDSFEPAGETVFSADGSRIALLLRHESWTIRIQIWDTMLGREVVGLQDQRQGLSMSRFVFSPCGRLFALMETGGMVRIMDAATGDERACINQGPRTVQSVFFAADGSTIFMMVSCSTISAISAFDTKTGKLLMYTPLTHEVLGNWPFTGSEIVLLPGNQKVAVATSTSSLLILDLREGGICETEVPCGCLKLYCPSGNNVMRPEGQACLLDMSPDGRFISYNKVPPHCVVTFLETETQKHWHIHCPHKIDAKEVTMAMNWAIGGRLLTWDPVNGPATVTITNVKTNENQLLEVSNQPRTRLTKVCAHPSMPLVATACSPSMSVRLWNLEESFCVAVYQGHDTSVQSLTFSPDGNLLASVTKSGTIKLWDTRGESGQGGQRGQGDDSAQKLAGRKISHAIVSENARYVATRSHQRLGTAMHHFVDVWDTQTGLSEQIHHSRSFDARYFRFIESGRQPLSTLRMALAPTNDRIAFSEDSDARIVVCHLAEGKKLRAEWLQDRRIRSDLQGSQVQFSPRGDEVVGLGYYGNAERYTFGVRDPLRVEALRKPDISQVEMMHVCSQDLRYSAHSYQAVTMVAVDVRKLENLGPIRTIDLPTDSIASMALSRNGHFLAVAFGDNSRVFEVQHGDEIALRMPPILKRTFSRQDEVKVCSVAFSSDSKSVVTVSADDMVWVWETVTGACRFKISARHMFEHIENGQLSNPINIGPLESAVALGKAGPDLAPIFGIRPASSHTCITRNGIDVLWLPSELRVQRWEVKNSTVAIFCESGETLFLMFNKDGSTYPKGLGGSPRFKVVVGADGVKEVVLEGSYPS